MIRPARVEERALLVQLGESTNLFENDEAEVLLGQSLDRVHSGAGEAHKAFVYEDEGGAAIGWAYVAPVDPFVPNAFELYFIGVRPGLQSRGVGSALLAEVESFVKQSTQEQGRKLFVSTGLSDKTAGARKFYEKFGFVKDRIVKDGYGEGEDQITYVKGL